MPKGLAIIRTEKQPDLYFFVEDSNGEKIQIKQTIKRRGNQTLVVTEAPDNVTIARGEILERENRKRD